MNFRKLFGLCQHAWIEVEHGDRFRFNLHLSEYIKVGKYWTYKCDKCHKVKEVRS